MRILDLDSVALTRILDYQSAGAASASIVTGRGDANIHWLRFEPGGVIGPHPAGPAQLLVPVEGRGWVGGPDGVRQPIAPGQSAFIASGEVHAKGSEEGMRALMIQLSSLSVDVR